jgi:prepilin signal peptidase PulO-like enzyme (type II secretory pathway)
MRRPDKKKATWKERIFHEIVEYWISVIYLTLVFAAFTQYRRFLLAHYDIVYANYWVAVIEALILAKVIMIGAVVRLGRGLEHKPLIYPTLYKAVVFSLFVIAFTVVEHAVKGLWSGKGLTEGVVELYRERFHELLAGTVVIFVALIPFFGVKELGRVLGEEKIRALFFRSSAVEPSPPDR